MENKKIMSITKQDGTVEEVELLIGFTFKDTNKEYVVFTKNEKDDRGNTTLYVSSIDRTNNINKLSGINSDEEWVKIKDVLRELAKNN